MIKLLVADDSPLMRRLLEGIFQAEGDFDIRLARNGAEALEFVHSFDPEVVTLDVQMPGVDGLACLGRIMLEAPRPVVMISSLTERGAEDCKKRSRSLKRGPWSRSAMHSTGIGEVRARRGEYR